MKHYVYKIINNKTNSIYVGSRSHIDPYNDSYMGSSKLLTYLIEKEGIERFDKIIIEVFDTRVDANNLEHTIVKELLETSPHTCYNKRLPGEAKREKQHNIRADIYNDYFEDIRQKYIQGVAIMTIAREYKAGRATIMKCIDDIYLKPIHNIWNHAVEVCCKYINGSSMILLSKEYNADIFTVKSVLIENNIDIRNIYDRCIKTSVKDIKPIDENLLIDMYTKGTSVRELSTSFNVSEVLILKRLKRNNIKIRVSWEVRPHRHPAWEFIKDIQVKYSEGYSKTKLCELYNIKDNKTLNKILNYKTESV